MAQSFAARGLCTKETVKATGLNIWTSGQNGQEEPKVEQVSVHKAEVASLTSVEALLQFKALVPIHTIHGLGGRLLSKI